MKILCRFIKRKYDLDMPPELICSVDEFTNDENPEYFIDESKEQMRLLGDELAGYTDIWIELDKGAIDRIEELCIGSNEPIKGKIVEG